MCFISVNRLPTQNKQTNEQTAINEVDIIRPILQLRELGLREVTFQWQTPCKWQHRDSDPSVQALNPQTDLPARGYIALSTIYTVYTYLQYTLEVQVSGLFMNMHKFLEKKKFLITGTLGPLFLLYSGLELQEQTV